MRLFPPSTPIAADPPAPVAGGMRWRRPWYGSTQARRRDAGPMPAGHEDPASAPYQPEPGLIGGPVISSMPPTQAGQGQEYIYQPKAFDAHTDGFTWSLQLAPAGMRVDRSSGRLTWIPAEGGHVDVILAARNPYGKTTLQRWTVCVRRRRPQKIPLPCSRYQTALARLVARRAGARFRHAAYPVWHLPLMPVAGASHQTSPPGYRGTVALPLRL